jgi:hypothetical protein
MLLNNPMNGIMEKILTNKNARSEEETNLPAVAENAFESWE